MEVVDLLSTESEAEEVELVSRLEALRKRRSEKRAGQVEELADERGGEEEQVAVAQESMAREAVEKRKCMQ